MLPHMCPHAAICVLMLLHVRCSVASSHMYACYYICYYYICTHATMYATTTYVRVLLYMLILHMYACYYICVLALLVLRYCDDYISTAPRGKQPYVRMLLYMCPHAITYVCMLLYVCPDATATTHAQLLVASSKHHALRLRRRALQ